MNLLLENTISGKELKTVIGNEKFKSLKMVLSEQNHYTCQCCGWEGAKEIENRGHLTIHVDCKNPEDIELADKYIVCKSCYLIKHIDLALENKFVTLVNSIYSQEDLIRISWSDCSKRTLTNNNREKAVFDKKIIKLKSDYNKVYKQKIDSGEGDKFLKVIFNDNFLIS